MLRYRLPNGDLLVEEDEWPEATSFRLNFDGTVRITDGGFIEPRTFVGVGPRGERRRGWGVPTTDALDDYLYVIGLCFVRDGQLIEGMLEMGGPGATLIIRLVSEQVRLEGLVLDLVAAAVQAENETLSDADVGHLARALVGELDRLGQEPSRAAWMVALLGKLAPRSEDAISRIVSALTDDATYDCGSSPYDAYVQSVSDVALTALYPLAVRARAAPPLLALLARIESLPESEKPHASARANVLNAVGWLGPRAAEAVPVLRTLAGSADPFVRSAASTALAAVVGEASR